MVLTLDCALCKVRSFNESRIDQVSLVPEDSSGERKLPPGCLALAQQLGNPSALYLHNERNHRCLQKVTKESSDSRQKMTLRGGHTPATVMPVNKPGERRDELEGLRVANLEFSPLGVPVVVTDLTSEEAPETRRSSGGGSSAEHTHVYDRLGESDLGGHGLLLSFPPKWEDP